MILCTSNHLLQIIVHEHLSSVTFQNHVSQQVLYSHKLELEIHSFHGLFVPPQVYQRSHDQKWGCWYIIMKTFEAISSLLSVDGYV